MEITVSHIVAIVSAIVAIVFIVLYFNANKSLEKQKSEFEKIKSELENYKNNPKTFAGAFGVITNMLLLNKIKNDIPKNPLSRDPSGNLLPSVEKELNDMNLFENKFVNSEELTNLLTSLGVSGENEFKDLLLKRVDTFTSLDISGFFKRNNMRFSL